MSFDPLNPSEIMSVISVDNELKERELSSIISNDEFKLSIMKMENERCISMNNHNPELIRHISEITTRITNNKFELNELLMFNYVIAHDALGKIAELRSEGREFEADLMAASYISQDNPDREKCVREYMNKKYSCFNCGDKSNTQEKMNVDTYFHTNVYHGPSKACAFKCGKCGYEDYGQALDHGFYSGINWKNHKSEKSKNTSHTSQKIDMSNIAKKSMVNHMKKSIDYLMNLGGPTLITMPLDVLEEIEAIRTTYNDKLSQLNLNVENIQYSIRMIDILRDVIAERGDNISQGWSTCLTFLAYQIFPNVERRTLAPLRDQVYKVAEEYSVLYPKFIMAVRSKRVVLDDSIFIKSGKSRKRIEEIKQSLRLRKSNLLFEYVIFQLLYVTLHNIKSFETDVNYILDMVPRVRIPSTLEKYEFYFSNFVNNFINNPLMTDVVGHTSFKWIHTVYYLGDFRSLVIKCVKV